MLSLFILHFKNFTKHKNDQHLNIARDFMPYLISNFELMREITPTFSVLCINI